MPRDDMLATYKELTAGMHKTALATQGLAVTQEAHEKRIGALEDIVKDDNNSLQTRTARSEDRLERIEAALEHHIRTASEASLARVQGRATIIAAWIGGGAAILGAIVALILALAKGG